MPKLRQVTSFQLDKAANRSIAGLIDLRELDPLTVQYINSAVNCYHATRSGSASTTVANTRFAFRQLKKPSRAREESIKLLADDRAAVDYTTHDLLQPLAKAVLNRQVGADQALERKAQDLDTALASHPRVSTSAEPLRFFCGVLRLIFDHCTDHLRGRTTEQERWHRCRRFALEVFSTAGITHANFDAHPERLTEYLQTDVSFD
jgi:hypothetical protein